jgi:hypothetical protein
MLINRKQTGWVWTTLILALLATAVYWFDPQAATRGHKGSNLVGLVFGLVALGIFIFCAALSLKRKVPHWKMGRAQAWLRGHVWFGLLAVWLVALHSGFGMGGPVTTIIWVLTGIVTVSALVGLGLQQVTPRLLLHSIPGETVAQQLDRVLKVVPGSSLALPPGPDPAKPAPWPKPPKAFDYTWENSVQEMAFSTVTYYAGVDGKLDKPCPHWDPEAAAPAPAVPSPAPVVAKAATPVPPAAVPTPAAPSAAPAAPAVTTTPAAAQPTVQPPVPAPAATAPAAKPAAPAVAPAAPAVPAAPKPAPPPPKKDVPPAGAEPLRRFWNEYGSAYFEGQDSVLEYPGKANSLLAALKTMTPAHIHPGIDGLGYLIERRRQLVRQRHMQRVLISWLLVHVPLSWGLLVLAIVHAVMALRWSEVSL